MSKEPDELPCVTVEGREARAWLHFVTHDTPLTEDHLAVLLAALPEEQLKRLLQAQLKIRHPMLLVRATESAATGDAVVQEDLATLEREGA